MNKTPIHTHPMNQSLPTKANPYTTILPPMKIVQTFDWLIFLKVPEIVGWIAFQKLSFTLNKE
jgi:hypothetical protein